jgi:hypothetical protein
MRTNVEDPAGQVPTGHQLRAALVAARAHYPMPAVRAADVSATYARIATDGIYASADLALGQEILEVAGLVRVRGDGILEATDEFIAIAILPIEEACDAILLRYLTAMRPLWLVAAASDDQVEWDLVPDREASVLAVLIPDFEQREAFLLACAHKVDPERDKNTGDLAEEHVTALCRAQLADCGRDDLAARVARVSLTSDRLGYDVVAPRLHGSSRRLEVKGTRAQGPGFMITLSRGEARQGLRDPDWSLVVCHVDADDSVSLLGWCTAGRIAPDLPTDGLRGRWRSVEIPIDDVTLTAGLPPC